MRAERNGKESAKKGRNGDAETGKMYMYEKRWRSFIEKERDTHTQSERTTEWKWNKMLMAKGNAGNERTERTSVTRASSSALSYKYV